MIPRYTRPKMGRIWSEENSFQKWLDVEILAAEGLARLGKVLNWAGVTVGLPGTDPYLVSVVNSIAKHRGSELVSVVPRSAAIVSMSVV